MSRKRKGDALFGASFTPHGIIPVGPALGADWRSNGCFGKTTQPRSRSKIENRRAKENRRFPQQFLSRLCTKGWPALFRSATPELLSQRSVRLVAIEGHRAENFSIMVASPKIIAAINEQIANEFSAMLRLGEVSSIEQLPRVVQRAGKGNLLRVEEYLACEKDRGVAWSEAE
jgi:hypothetical protein